eukprot:TRINITY_DN10502_c0_g1_i1.p1 TRINITY_DN10502_c0_g1~~TRINITY_DN10502_c0_g1_i1.p1  ORF type:complete len:499 (-),score=57.87 TRINITY_DN10502_c0_g1_i1:44-1516(-)
MGNTESGASGNVGPGSSNSIQTLPYSRDLSPSHDLDKGIIDFRSDPTVTDDNVADLAAKVLPLDRIISIDLSWTKLTLEGLADLLPRLTALQTLIFETPIMLSKFPALMMPKSLLRVSLHRTNGQYDNNWTDASVNNDLAAFQRFHRCFTISKLHGVTADDEKQYFYHTGFGGKMSSAAVCEALIERHFSAKSVHLQCNSYSEGAWKPDAIEAALRSLPPKLVDLSFTCANDRKPKNERGGGTKSEFWDHPSDPAVLGSIAALLGSSLERLSLNIPHVPKSEWELLTKFEKLEELEICGQCSLHLNSDSFPSMPKLKKLIVNVHMMGEDSKFLQRLLEMKNLTYLDLGGNVMDVKWATTIGNNLLNLKTLTIDSLDSALLDAFVQTPLSTTLEAILTHAEWLINHLLAPGELLRLPMLRYAMIMPPKKWLKSLPSCAKKKPEKPESYVCQFPHFESDHLNLTKQNCAALFDDTPRRPWFVALDFGPYDHA